MSKPRIVLLRGYHANPWELRAWSMLADRFDVTVLVPRRNVFESHRLGVPSRPARAVRDYLPRGRAANALAYAVGDRYADLASHLADADIVHSTEIATWFSAQAAALKPRLGFRLAVTVWETIPFLEAYRWPRERRYREAVLPRADLFLPATERARNALVLEGIEAERLLVCEPGIDVDHFSVPSRPEPLVVSPGRLVWEKGHQDVMRAVAWVARGDSGDPVTAAAVRLLIVGAGPEAKRLARHAGELGIADRVEFRANVPYDEMPGIYARAACVALGSLPAARWEEQFGMVFAEAMAAGVPIITTTSGAIPEVVGGAATLVPPGGWHLMANAIAGAVRAQAQGAVVEAAPRELVERYSNAAAATRIAAAYERLGSTAETGSSARS